MYFWKNQHEIRNPYSDLVISDREFKDMYDTRCKQITTPPQTAVHYLSYWIVSSKLCVFVAEFSGTPQKIVVRMTSPGLVPVMQVSEEWSKFGHVFSQLNNKKGTFLY